MAKATTHSPCRISTIDVAKGLGILLVVFAHVNYINPPNAYIYSFHMPLFFIISGVVFNASKYHSFFKFAIQKTKALLFPYFLFSLLSIFLRYGLAILSQDNLHIRDFLKHFLQIFIAQHSGTMDFNTPLWFVPCLFVTEILSYFILKVRNRYVQVSVSVICAIIGWFTQSSYSIIDFSFLPWNFGIAMLGQLFFVMGNYLRAFVYSLDRRDLTKIQFTGIAIATIAIGTVLYFLSNLNGQISMGSRHVNNIFLFVLNGCLGTFMVLFLARMMRWSKFLTFCGMNSFYIMATHRLIQYLLELSLIYIIGCNYEYTGIVWKDSIIMFIAVMIAEMVFVVAYQLIKKMIGEKKNGRTVRNPK